MNDHSKLQDPPEMRLSLFSIAVLSLSALVAPAVHADGKAQTPPALPQRLDAVVDRALAERRIVGAVVLVARDGEVVYRRAAGWSDRELRMPMREDAIFRYASLTKPIVSALIVALAQDGTLNLDDPVTRWLPRFRPHLADGTRPAITLRQLLTHTAGLSYGFAEAPGNAYERLGVSDGLDRPGLSIDKNLHRLAKAPLFYPPGQGWRYSLSLDVLGAVAAKAARKPLPELVRTRITGPLGMRDTGFAVADRGRLVAPYIDGKPEPVRMETDVRVPLWQGAVQFSPGRVLNLASYPSGGAGMVGTAGDFLRFLETVRSGGGGLLSDDSAQAMMRDHVGAQAQTRGPGWGFGYGGAVLDDPAAAQVPHGKGTFAWGGVYGHSWFVDPQQRLTVIALTNTAMEGMSGAFPTEIRDAVYAALEK